MPDAFVIACLLTLITFGLVTGIARRTPIDALDYWLKGFWELLEFTMQMALILLTGFMIATAPAVSSVLRAIAKIPKTSRGTVALIALVSMGVSWIHWGLGLVAAPLFLGFVVREHPDVDYRLAVAAGYLGSACTWHAGLSGSAPLLMATPNHFLAKEVGIIPMSTTTFSPFNLTLTSVIVATMTALAVVMCPRTSKNPAQSRMSDEPSLDDMSKEGLAAAAAPASRSFAETLETRYWLNLVMGLLGAAGFFAVYARHFQVSLNVFNFAFLFLALLLHPNPRSFMRSAAQGTGFLHGIIIQFPFYAGMYGLIRYSGLAETIAHGFVSIASPRSFALIVYWYSGVLSYFIPSGGSKWAVEAPYILAAAKTLGVPPQQAIIAYAWGDMSTHFLQPFWAIPLLTIAKIDFKDIVGYLAIFFMINILIVSAAFLLLPLVW